MSYKQTTTLNERKLKSFSMKQQYPDRIPVIVEVSKKVKNPNLKLDKIKYLIPLDITLGQLSGILRKRLKVDSTKALFFFINNKNFPITTILSTIYESEKDEDDFLYVEIAEESTFG